MKLVLIGIQGAGKSTQGNLLSKQLKIPYLSTGHIFREIAKEKTSLGRYVKETINSGILIPDEKTIAIVEEYLSRAEYQRGYILDGFPRTMNQAGRFKNGIDRVIYLRIPDKDALWRIAYRNDHARADESLPALKKRIELFHRFTEPVLQFYEKKGKLVEIDGTQSIKEVNEEILKCVGKQLIKNQITAWKQKQKTIMAIVGLPGSGKTEAANFFRAKKLPVISFGKAINDYVDQHHLPHTETVHKEIREGLRKKHGIAALAILNETKIRQALRNNQLVIIDGMRSWEEYLYLKKVLPKVRMFIVGLFVNKDIRSERIAKRKERARLYGERRDIDELIGTNMGPTFSYADYLIKNNFSLKEFFDKLEEVYRSIYFS
ncbi:nucleoside monophosphate kinase [Patescibacteria group bacterium]|nr:nucleoside monophosphate kinase [Patescibacteria group bacterium]MCL5091690.1 nucleoside monophosphate kinase [Patescibacteria group bacterium]